VLLDEATPLGLTGRGLLGMGLRAWSADRQIEGRVAKLAVSVSQDGGPVRYTPPAQIDTGGDPFEGRSLPNPNPEIRRKSLRIGSKWRNL
jgi:hypothetical protein